MKSFLLVTVQSKNKPLIAQAALLRHTFSLLSSTSSECSYFKELINQTTVDSPVENCRLKGTEPTNS